MILGLQVHVKEECIDFSKFTVHIIADSFPSLVFVLQKGTQSDHLKQH